jgi:hypothetical protein
MASGIYYENVDREGAKDGFGCPEELGKATEIDNLRH